ncbi:MAG: ion transporter [Myxococcales bacterium]|nr:ion transporter [Myxococcales bacterium]MCB9526121.1 ion transporter [Myxococcales bacterium]
MTELFDYEDEALPPRKRPWHVPAGLALPPPPPGTRHVSLGRYGRIIADDDLRERVERAFHWPMILLALAVLPLFAIEVFEKPTGRLEYWLEFGFAVIWVAFLVEFVVKIAVAESRLEYVKRNWLDLVVILLPVLRVLRLSALARSIRLLKLRGVAFKFARTAITLFVSFEIADRVLRRLGFERPERPPQPKPEGMTRYQLIDEVVAGRAEIHRWHDWYARHRAFLEARGVLTYELEAEDPPPAAEADGGSPPTLTDSPVEAPAEG